MMIALATKRPDFAITENEARDLADAIATVGKEYDVKVSGKAAATGNLILTAAIIYGPRIYLASKGGASIATPAAQDKPAPVAVSMPPSKFPDPFGKRN